MKKLLILTFLVSSLCYAETSEPSKGSMKITATVIKPLNVTATNIAFGTIVAGTTVTAEPGIFTIDGEKNTKYVAYIEELGKDKQEGKINLLNGKNKLPVTITSDLKFQNTLDADGKATETIDAVAITKKETVPGLYKGNLTLNVRYE